MPLPDYQSLMLPVLKTATNGEIRVRSATQILADEFQLSEEERAKMRPAGKQSIFADRVGWAKYYLKKARLVENTRRGYFQITKRGRKILKQEINSIDIKFLKQFDEFNQVRKRTTKKDEETKPIRPSSTRNYFSKQVMRTIHQQSEELLANELLGRILNATANFFERLMITLLIEMGYGESATDAGRVLGQSSDGGVDGVIDQDVLGLDQIYIQAKRHAIGNNIGSGAIRDFFGSLDRHKANKGLFFTTSAFSKQAQKTASSLSKRIVLIDGQDLISLMIYYHIGCHVEETLYLTKVNEDFWE